MTRRRKRRGIKPKLHNKIAVEQKTSNFPILSAVLLTQFIMPFMFSGITVTLPSMGREFQASAIALGLVEIVYLGASGALMIPFGRIADLTDKQFIFKVGLLLSTLTTLSLGFATSIEMCIVIRLLQGVTIAMTTATNLAILADIYPREKLGRILGIAVGTVYVGLSAGPFIAGLITEWLGWRWIYYLVAAAMLVAYFQSVSALKGKWKQPTSPLDWGGGFLAIAILALWIIGSSTLNKGTMGLIFLVSGALLVPIFIMVENRAEAPLLEFNLFPAHPVFTRALIIQLFTYSGAFGVTFLFSLYLQTVKGFSPQHTGMVLMISPVIMAVMAPIFGRLADKARPEYLATGGVILTFAGTLLATGVTAVTAFYTLGVILALQGMGFGMFTSPNMKIIMTSIDKKHLSIASALTAQTRSFGMIISMLLVTLYLSLLMGEAAVTVETSASYLSVMRYSLISLAGLGAIAIFMSIRQILKKTASLQ